MKRIGIVLLVLMAIVSPSLLADTYTATAVKLYGSSGGSADVIPANGHSGLVTITPGHVSIANSTTDLLDPGGLFTGAWEDITNFGVIVISTLSDQASAADGLMVQFSSDGTVPGIISDDDYTVAADAKKTFSFQAAAKYFRVTYTNGGTIQTAFNLQTILKPYYVKPSSHRIQDAIIDDDDSELVKAVLTGSNPAGDFVNFQATMIGNFKISLEELENDVSSNNNTQLNVNSFHVDGTEGQLITGVDYVVGKSGIDATTESIQTISYEHHEIHEGNHYFLEDFVTLGAAGAIDFTIQTPNTTEESHIVWEIQSQSEITFQIYEAATITFDGTDLTAWNNNRNSGNTSNWVNFESGSTVTAVGTLLGQACLGNATNPVQNVPGGGQRNRELILKTNTIYLFRITSTNAANCVSYLAEWYEHTPKN